MENIKNFENFINEDYQEKTEKTSSVEKVPNSLSKKVLIKRLLDTQNVYNQNDLQSMNIDQLKNLAVEVGNANDEDRTSDNSGEEFEYKGGEETSELEFESKKWIKDAIKRPGALRRNLHKKKGEKISGSEINSELQSLKSKNKLSKKDRTKEKELVLAKTLRGMRDK